MVVQSFLHRCSFIILQSFLIGFKPGEFPGKSNTAILLKLIKLLTFDWYGAKSCRKSLNFLKIFLSFLVLLFLSEHQGIFQNSSFLQTGFEWSNPIITKTTPKTFSNYQQKESPPKKVTLIKLSNTP